MFSMSETEKQQKNQPSAVEPVNSQKTESPKPEETGGPKGLEPTRYGDWEKNGRCIDF